MNKFVAYVEDWTKRPSIENLGSNVHHLWHGANFGMVDRRDLMCRVATELLSRLGDDRVIAPGSKSVDEVLLDQVWALKQDPENVERKLLADALYGALRIVNSPNDPRVNMEAGGLVYGPLFVLAGVLIANEATPSKPRKLTIPHADLERFRRSFARKRGGKDHGWKKAAAAHYQVAVSTIYRHLNP